ncbi:O-antigen ligase family protein [Crocinitomicaceae bacterium]|nr:O-antigen ligase family protein [Crocinitomicaceae bacterium]
MNTKLLFALLALILLSMMTSLVTLNAYEVFKKVLGHIFWYITFIKLVNDLDRIKGVFSVYVFMHILILVLNPQLVLNPETRSYILAAPFLGDGNDFALSLCIALPMSFYLFLEAKSRLGKLLWLGCALLHVFAIIGTQSRGATLALASLILYLWLNSSKKFMGLFLLCLTLLIVVSYAPDVYFNRMSTISNYEQESSAKGRIIAWKSAMRMAADNPILGVGAGSFPVALGTSYRPPEWGDKYLPWVTAHSLYFLVLGEMGFPGLILFLVLIIGNYRRVNKLYKAASDSMDGQRVSYTRLFLALNSSLIGFAVGGAFLSVAYYPHLYILLGLIVASTFIFESSNNNGSSPVGLTGNSAHKRIL